MNIVVLAGGLSGERDVSLTSGTLVCNALRRSGHSAILVDLFFGVEDVSQNILDAFTVSGQLEPYKVPPIAPDLGKIRAMRGDSGYGEIGKNVIELCRAADIVFMGLHGESGENGKLQAVFDVMGIKYTGSGYLGSAIAMNKGMSRQVLLSNGINMARGNVYSKAESAHIAGDFSLPLIVKPVSGGSSIGVTKAETEEELRSAIVGALEYEDEILVEEFIAGREFSCGVLGERALPIVEIIPNEGFYDYEHKYQAGMTKEVCPAELDEENTKKIQQAALKAHRALGLNVYSRIDFILGKDGGIYCLEANTLPGMTPMSLIPQEASAAGMPYEQLCEEIIRLSLKRFS
jgi:D-alanine-D-alanine ligase